MSKKARKTVFTAVKLLLAAGLLVWVFRGVDLGQFAETVRKADPWLLVAALAGFMLSLVVIAFRLRLLLRTQDIEIRLWEVVRLTYLGQFFNAVVPGVVGGDLVKAYYAAKHTDHKAAAVVAVLVDRLMGLAELAVLAGAMVLVLLAAGESPAVMRRSAIAAGVALAGVCGMLVFMLSARFRRAFHLRWLYRRLPIGHHIEAAAAAAARFRRHWGDLVRAFYITFAAHGTWIAGVALAGRAMGVQVAWYYYFLFVPLIYIIGAVPVTPGGAGLVEASYALFFASLGVPDDRILALALTARVLDIARGLPGAVVAVRGARVPHAEQLEAELAEEEGEEQPYAVN
jgi:hypothetical protein